jgi:hypothetical protein
VPTGLLWLSRHDRQGRFLRDVQGSVQIGIVKDRPKAGNHLSIGLALIREYMPIARSTNAKNVSLRRNANTTAEELMMSLNRATVSASGRL